jgi:hypothetical protein
MLEEGLARVRTNLDLDALWFTATEGNHLVAEGSLADEADRGELEKFFWRLLPTLPAPPTIVHSREGHFMNKPDSVISLINLATLRSLEDKWGVELDPPGHAVHAVAFGLALPRLRDREGELSAACCCPDLGLSRTKRISVSLLGKRPTTPALRTRGHEKHRVPSCAAGRPVEWPHHGG